MFITRPVVVCIAGYSLYIKHVGGLDMCPINKTAKLINISKEQSQKLKELNDRVIESGGYSSVSQLIREAIDILINNYSDEVIKKYKPICLKELVKSQ
jgi:hypothetical protein